MTKPEVIHAEINAIGKLAKSTVSSVGADMFCSVEPCFECAKLILVSGIRSVYYAESYECANGGHQGLAYLNSHGIYTALVSMHQSEHGRSVFLIS